MDVIFFVGSASRAIIMFTFFSPFHFYSCCFSVTYMLGDELSSCLCEESHGFFYGLSGDMLKSILVDLSCLVPCLLYNRAVAMIIYSVG